MGSPIFAVKSLHALYRHHEVLSVYTQPPRPSGRGMQVRPTAVAEYAKINNNGRINLQIVPKKKIEKQQKGELINESDSDDNLNENDDAHNAEQKNNSIQHEHIWDQFRQLVTTAIRGWVDIMLSLYHLIHLNLVQINIKL